VAASKSTSNGFLVIRQLPVLLLKPDKIDNRVERYITLHQKGIIRQTLEQQIHDQSDKLSRGAVMCRAA